MPNWCWNEITFRGEPDDCRAFRELMGAERATFDFNAVAPMPPELLDCNNAEQTAYEIKYGEWELEPWWGGTKYPSREASLQAARHPENSDRWKRVVFGAPHEPPTFDPQTFDQAADTGHANVLLHGHAYWYPWAVEHWGTKWSAGKAEWSSSDGVERVTFETAWGPPLPILEQLSQRFPLAELEAVYDEPQMPFRGRFVLAGGAVVEREHHGGEAYEGCNGNA
jgi:hypothetical protein